MHSSAIGSMLPGLDEVRLDGASSVAGAVRPRTARRMYLGAGRRFPWAEVWQLRTGHVVAEAVCATATACLPGSRPSSPCRIRSRRPWVSTPAGLTDPTYMTLDRAHSSAVVRHAEPRRSALSDAEAGPAGVGLLAGSPRVCLRGAAGPWRVPASPATGWPSLSATGSRRSGKPS